MAISRRLQSQVWLIVSVVLVVATIGVGVFLFIENNRFKKYTNDGVGMKIRYPASWTVKEGVAGTIVAFISAKENEMDTFQENVNIDVQDLERPMNLSQYSEILISQLKTVFNNIEVVESMTGYLGKYSGHQLLYLAKSQESNLKFFHVWFLKDRKAYKFTYVATEPQYEKSHKMIQSMIKSFFLAK